LPAGHLCGRFYPRTWTHEWLPDWMSDWLTGSLNDWLTDRINDWLTDGHATIAATTNISAEKGERRGGDQLFPFQVLCLPNLCSPSPPLKWGRSRVGLEWDGIRWVGGNVYRVIALGSDNCKVLLSWVVLLVVALLLRWLFCCNSLL